jgi:hypothetical protein
VTFGEARTILRNDVLAEASTDYYSDADLLGFLKRAAKELALTFGFPREISTVSLISGQSSFTLPADAANIDLQEVVYDGFSLALAPYRVIANMVGQSSLGQPRFYNFDPKRASSTVRIAPAATRAASITFEYIQEYDVNSVTDSTPVWGGLFPAYHELVVFRAAVKAFDASLETERAAYWLEREQRMSQEFSLFLNKTPANAAIAQEVAES